ncbi:hypothetical protein D1007_06584 [Hordeum vulgare]|nr:hypothetical protein D1007_06584 [Hordeum vulgare]
MSIELAVITEVRHVSRTETAASIYWNAVELDESTDLVIALMCDTEMAKLFGIPVDDRGKEMGESSLPANAHEDVHGQLLKEVADDVDDAHDDELVHVYEEENSVIEMGKLWPNMYEFRMCFKTYVVKHEFDAKIVWTHKKKIYATCTGYEGEVEKRSLGSAVEIDTEVSEEGEVKFSMLFMPLKPCIDGFKTQCRPHFSIYSSFFSRKWNGQLGACNALEGQN